MKNLKNKTNKTYRESWFSRINWIAHLVPTAKSAHQNFCSQLEGLDLPAPRISVVSEDVRAGYFAEQNEELWTDSVSFSFGCRAVPGKPVIPVKGRFRVLSEEQACLVLSQSLSGSVVALLYPPSSDVAKPLKPFYIVDFWNNPHEANQGRIVKLLKLTLETDYYCGAANYPNPIGQRIMAKLEAKDAVLANGGSRIWVWLKYVLRVSKGVLRLHGIGSPFPRA